MRAPFPAVGSFCIIGGAVDVSDGFTRPFNRYRHCAPGRAPRLAYSMRALGKRDLPCRLDLRGAAYRLIRTVKHDFFAATGFYFSESDPSDRIVLKMGRSSEFMGIPLFWVGRFL